MSSRLIRISNASCVAVLAVTSSAFAAHYIVKPRETLSQIAAEKIQGPVWGKTGSLVKVLALNPRIRNADRIFPGESIDLGNADPVQAKSNPQREVSCPADPETLVKEAAELKRAPASDLTSDDLGNHLQATVGYRFSTISAQDPLNSSSAKLFTSSDLEFAAGWSQDWNQSFSTFFEFGFEKLNFEASNNPSKSLSNTSQSPAHFDLGADIHAGASLVFRTSVSYGQELFTGTQDNASISIDSVFVPALSEELIFSAIQRGHTSFGLVAGATYLFGAAAGSYTVNSGHAINGGGFINQNFGHEGKNSLMLLVGYENRNQNTSLVNQSQDDVFAKLTFSIPIFEGAEK